MTDWIIIGKVGRTQGLKGWVRVYSYTDPYPNLCHYRPWYLRITQHFQAITVTDCQLQGKLLLAHFEGIDTPEAAQALTHAEIAIMPHQLPPTAPDEYYWHDLVGLAVYNLTEQYLGKVDHLFSGGAQDILAITQPQAQSPLLLIPFVIPPIVKQVDLTAGKIIVDWTLDAS